MRLDLTRVIEGVVFDPRDNMTKYPDFKTRQDPLYMVDLVVPKNMYLTFAHCYEIDSRSLKQYRKTKHDIMDVASLTKAHYAVEEIDHPFGKQPATVLAKAANSYYMQRPKKYLKTIYRAPLFTSIVSKAQDTFTGRQERCIIEREPTRTIASGFGWNRHKKAHKVIGRPTGIKIGLSNFLPIREYSPHDEILNQLKNGTHSILQLYLGDEG